MHSRLTSFGLLNSLNSQGNRVTVVANQESVQNVGRRASRSRSSIISTALAPMMHAASERKCASAQKCSVIILPTNCVADGHGRAKGD